MNYRLGVDRFVCSQDLCDVYHTVRIGLYTTYFVVIRMYLYRDLVSRSTNDVRRCVLHRRTRFTIIIVVCSLQLVRHPLIHTLTPKTNKNDTNTGSPPPSHLLHDRCRKTNAHNNSNYPLLMYTCVFIFIINIRYVLYLCTGHLSHRGDNNRDRVVRYIFSPPISLFSHFIRSVFSHLY